MNHASRKALLAGAVGVVAAIGLPVCALAQQQQGMTLKMGCNYAIGFQDGSGLGPAPVAANGAAQIQRPLAVYRVTGVAGDQQWYRVRMVVRNPQGGWLTPPGAPDVWINLAYTMWVQEVTR